VPARDLIHGQVVAALQKSGWEVTDDPYVVVYCGQQIVIDLAAKNGDAHESEFIGAERHGQRIAVEIKSFLGKSGVADLEQALGQYVLYNLVLTELDSERIVYVAVSSATYEDVFQKPLGQLVVQRLPLRLIVVDLETTEVTQWIPPLPTAT